MFLRYVAFNYSAIAAVGVAALVFGNALKRHDVAQFSNYSGAQIKNFKERHLVGGVKHFPRGNERIEFVAWVFCFAKAGERTTSSPASVFLTVSLSLSLCECYCWHSFNFVHDTPRIENCTIWRHNSYRMAGYEQRESSFDQQILVAAWKCHGKWSIRQMAKMVWPAPLHNSNPHSQTDNQTARRCDAVAFMANLIVAIWMQAMRNCMWRCATLHGFMAAQARGHTLNHG